MSKKTENADDFLRIHEGIMKPGLSSSLRRIAYVSLIGVASMLLLGELLDLSDVSDIYSRPIAIIMAVLGINLLSEGNIIINRVLNRRMPWSKQLKRRIGLQLALSFAWLTIIYLFFYLTSPRSLSKGALISFIFGTIFIMGFNGVLILRNFAYNWRQSILENEELKQAKLHADYMALQNQLNPHFLFNSFSVLISEIQYNPISAVEFAQKMSDVYRYVLQQRNATTTALKSELDFIADYYYLHQIRMGETLDLKTDIDPEHLNLEIPPLTLQILIENAIKHNRATEKKPLQIRVSSSPDRRIQVSNNIHRKSSTYSTGTGLENITKRYRLLTPKALIIEDDNGVFQVSLPLLEKHELPKPI